MQNEDNEINIDHDNREEKEGEKVNMVHRIQVEGKKVSPQNPTGLSDEQPGRTDLSRRNSRKGGFPNKQVPSLATGSCNKQPLEKKNKLKRANKQDHRRQQKIRKSKEVR